MKSLLISLLLLTSCASVPVKSGPVQHEAFVLASLHGAMLNKPGYSLNEFVAAMDHFRPDLILTEVRTDRPGAVEGSLDGGFEQSLVYAYGNVANVPVIPVDVSEASLGKASPKPTAKQSALLKKRITPFVVSYRASVQNDNFFDLHSTPVQANIRKMYETYEKAGITGSRVRNAGICTNIGNTLATTKSKRILVIFGIERKYALDECLKNSGAELVSADDFVDQQQLASFISPESLRTQTVANLRASLMFLEQNLARGVYRGSVKAQMQEKASSFPKWIEAADQLR